VFLRIADGSIPNRQQFNQCCNELKCITFHFINDDRLGTCNLSIDQLWAEISNAHDEMIALEQAIYFDSRQYIKRYDWLKSILSTLKIEWNQ
jgi:hypothetical protein